MYDFFIIDDPESEYHGKIAEVIDTVMIGLTLTMYYCKIDSDNLIGFLSHQLGKGFALRCEAERWINKYSTTTAKE